MNKTLRIDNQQGSRRAYNGLCVTIDPSETTRRAPFSKKVVEAYLLGAIHDGTFSSNKRFRISQKGTEWLEVLQKCFAYLGYKSWIYKEGKDREVYVLETLAKFLDFNFNPLSLKRNSEKAGYIRGFFDAEGGIPKNSKASFYIQLAQKNEKKMRDIKNILMDLKIKTGKIHNPSYKVDPNYWRIYVSAKSQKAFVEKISSWHPRKIKTLAERVKI